MISTENCSNNMEIEEKKDNLYFRPYFKNTAFYFTNRIRTILLFPAATAVVLSIKRMV
jgi:hypothetical protein